MSKKYTFLFALILFFNCFPSFSQMLDNNVLINLINNYDKINDSIDNDGHNIDMENILNDVGDDLNLIFHKIYNGNINSENELNDCYTEFMELINVDVSVEINNIFINYGIGNNGVCKLLYIMMITRLIYSTNNLMKEFIGNEINSREIFFNFQLRLYCLSSFLNLINESDYELLRNNNEILFNLLMG
jgi:hypothetical protein